MSPPRKSLLIPTMSNDIKMTKSGTKDKKILRFLLEQQLPDAKVVAHRGGDTPPISTAGDVITVAPADQVTQVALETCRCTHLQEHLPHILDTQLCKAAHHPRGWVVANPVHSLHLATQLEDSTINRSKVPPVLYGEEQQRTMALKSEGIAEFWSPLDGYSSITNDTAQKPSNSVSHARPIVPNPTPTISQSAPTGIPTTTPVTSASVTSKLPTSLATTGGAPQVTPMAIDKQTPVSTNAVPTATAAGVPPPPSSDTPVTGVQISSALQPTPVVSGIGPTSDKTPIATGSSSAEDVSAATTQSPKPTDLPAQGTSIPAPPSTVAKPESVTPNQTESAQHADPAKNPSPDGPKSAPAPAAAPATTAIDSTKALDSDTQATVASDTKPKTKELVVDSSEASGPDSKANQDVKAEPSNEPTQTETPAQDSTPVLPSSIAPTVATKSDNESAEPTSKDGADPPTTTTPATDAKPADTATIPESKDPDAPTTGPLPTTNVSPSGELRTEGTKALSGPDQTSSGMSENGPKTGPPHGPNPNNTTPMQIDGITLNPSSGGSSEAMPPPLVKSMNAPPLSTALNPVPTTSAAVGIPTKPASTKAASAPFPPAGVSPNNRAPPFFDNLRMEEDRIRTIRLSLASHRTQPPKKKVDTKKKRKRESDQLKAPGIRGWRPPTPKELSPDQEVEWLEASSESRTKVERWMENYRLCRETYWDEQQAPSREGINQSFFPSTTQTSSCRGCELCPKPLPVGKAGGEGGNRKLKNRRIFSGDDLMQCLDCGFLGCSPKSVAKDSREHILQHLLISGHKFAVTCGARARLFCFCCGDFVYNDVFEEELKRIDYTKRLPLSAWKHDKVHRSFDPFQFLRTQEHGIVWRGLIATYPQLVPKEHILATELTSRRQSLFEGRVQEKWLLTRMTALNFAASQNLLGPIEKYAITAPVGMYNLGNTCFKSSVLQCLIHCKPLQRYFLQANGHPHHSCPLYRQREAALNKRKKKKSAPKPEDSTGSICMACEMDRLYLAYFGSAVGKDVRSAVDEACTMTCSSFDVAEGLDRGDPLVVSKMLTASWKSGGMNNLTGYKQHDAHEFLNAFLGLMGKHSRQHWDRVHSAICTVKEDNAVALQDKSQSGSLRSVLLCEECGNKRTLNEAFLNVSLTLSEEVERLQSSTDASESQLSVEGCLEHFVLPEKLGDSVDCPSCARKTSTKKQHTFAKLPKILCLHLKRFDAAKNRKISDFVSYPARGLNMGKYLSHWCEVSGIPSTAQGAGAEPSILYDLFGTVNHIGTMQSGHYVTNVKVDDQWYHCNDAHIGRAGEDGEAATLKSVGAYILFYVRR